MADVLHVDAHAMGEAFAADAELVLPGQPCLVPELVLAPMGDGGVVVTGGPATETFRGRAVPALLLPLLPLLDGTRRLDELAALLPGCRADDVENAVALLFSRGLLQDGPISAPGPEFAELAAFLGRHVDATRVNGNRQQALDRLTQTVVTLWGDPHLTGPIGAQLTASGVTVSRPTDAGRVAAGTSFSVVASSGADPVSPAEVERALHVSESCLVARLGAAEAHIGPVLVRGTTICSECLERAVPHPVGKPGDDQAAVWSSLAAHIAVLELSRVGTGTALHRGVVRYSAAVGGPASTVVVTPRTPGCVRCGIGGAAWDVDDERLLAWTYHVGSTVSWRSAIGMRDHQRHYLAANVNLAEAKEVMLHSATSVRLDRVALDERRGQAAAAGERTAALDDLAALLPRVAGRSAEPPYRRVAPTGGNLGSVRIWVLAQRVPGLAPGSYLYEPDDHSLRFYGEVDARLLSSYLGRPAEVAGAVPDCVLVGAGDLAKCARKYDAFAYRLVHLDAGVSLSYLHAVCEARGLAVTEFPDVDLAVTESFGVPRRWEFPLPTFVVAIGRVPVAAGGAGASEPMPRRPGADEGSEPDSDPVVAMMNATLRRPPALTPTSTSTYGARGPVSGTTPSRLDAALHARRAIRRFAPDLFDVEELQRLAGAAKAAVDTRVRAGAAESVVRPVVLLPKGGASLEAGVYELSDEGVLARRAPFSPAQAWETCLQAGLAAAPATLVLVGDLRRSLAQRGARGYCELALHAGAAVGGAWMSAAVRGLVGTAAGGVLADGLRAAAGMDGFNECPVVAFHVGRPRHDRA